MSQLTGCLLVTFVKRTFGSVKLTKRLSLGNSTVCILCYSCFILCLKYIATETVEFWQLLKGTHYSAWPITGVCAARSKCAVHIRVELGECSCEMWCVVLSGSVWLSSRRSLHTLYSIAAESTAWLLRETYACRATRALRTRRHPMVPLCQRRRPQVSFVCTCSLYIRKQVEMWRSWNLNSTTFKLWMFSTD